MAARMGCCRAAFSSAQRVENKSRKQVPKVGIQQEHYTMWYYKPDTGWTSQSPSGYSSSVFNDVFFLDDRTGYLLGDSAGYGILLKVISLVNIQTLSIPNSLIPWKHVSLNDGYTVTSGSQILPSVIAFSDRYHGLIGGSFRGTNTSPYPYVRLFDDEGGYFSSQFYYDVLGRLIVSQNSKQFNLSPTASYTLYDALGRITEVGEKYENTTNTNKFAGIFGTSVNNYFNPQQIDNTKLSNWINDGTGARKEVTHTFYDSIEYTGIPVVQQNLRNRVASTTYEYLYDANPATYNHATHYSYDIHGNVNTLIQDNPSLAGITDGSSPAVTMQYKRIDYAYDLVSGNVNQVSYQAGHQDRFFHEYSYDLDNRITNVQTSRDSILWDCDAKYFYYAHGPLARVELGDNQIQGMDYAYTLQGWIKGVNSNVLKDTADMGQDGLNGSINQSFARDAFGYSLNYYNGDYKPIGTPTSKYDSAFASLYGSGGQSLLVKARHDLYNGNISSMVTTITPPTALKVASGTPAPAPQGTAYKYDQLNRLIEMQAYQNLTASSNSWGTTGTYGNLYHNTFTYDANGNILTQVRNDSMGYAMDNLTYKYAQQGGQTIQNRLYHVNNSVTGYAKTDVPDQGTFTSTLTTINSANNYEYDHIGDLVKDKSEQIDTIIWNVYGKVYAVIRNSGSSKENLYFNYDSKQDRIAKNVYTSSNTWLYSDYYVRDAQGNIMTIYRKQTYGSTPVFKVSERNIYGSSMIGTDYDTLQLIGAPPVASIDTTSRFLGHKHFNLENHLGNVEEVVSDKPIPRTTIAMMDTTFDHNEATVLSAVDYSPFGVELNGRTFNQGAGRYAFNGQEKDNEVTGIDGATYAFEFRGI
jgi:hypothetical protein